MSMRSSLLEVQSLTPIATAIASQDTALVEAIRSHDPQDMNLVRIASDMIMCETPPADEPGSWALVLPIVAVKLGLTLNEPLPLGDDWKHFDIWEDYITELKAFGEIPCAAHLSHLKDGRPLQGNSVSCDGCLFAWLNQKEVSELYGSLKDIEEHDFNNHELGVFHETFVESLEIINENRTSLMLTAR